MSTYFATYPLTVPFPLLSEAFKTSVYWEPSLSVSISVLNATSPAIAELRAASSTLDEAFRAEYEAMRDFFVETLEKFKGTDPEIDDYIARIYTTFLEQTVDTDVYGEPVEWSVNSFTSFSPQYLLDEVEWFQHLPESKREEFITNSSNFNRGSSNYFYGLASAYNAVLRRVISKRRLDWDLWREIPKLQEMYARIELFRDQMQVRNSLRGENSDEVRRLEEVMRVELSAALLALVTARFSSDITWEEYSPTNRYSNHMAYVETKITNPTRAYEIASQVQLEVDNNSLNLLTALQDDFPKYEIPLEVDIGNQTGMVSNLNMSRNGRRDDYPVKDAITGNYLWVGGDEGYTSIRRYGGNGPAVDSLESFFEYVFPETRLVSEYEDEYAIAGRSADDFDGYVDEYNRYQALATGQGELQEGDELFVLDGEFDLEAAISGLREYYSYYGSVEAVIELQFMATGRYEMPLEKLYEGVNTYDDAMEEYTDATPFTVEFESETFKTQQGESYLMEDASRPFFDPAGEGPYELSESPSGSEVSYGAEILTKELEMKPKSAYIRGDFDRFGLSHPVITFYDFIPRGISDGEITTWPLEGGYPHQIHRSTGVTEEDINELISAYNDWYDAGNSRRPGDRMPYPWDGDYYDYRTQRVMSWGDFIVRNYYRDDLGETLNSMSQAEEFGAESKPRLSKKQLESLNIMKMSYYHRNNDSAYVEVDNRGYKPFMSRPVQGLLNKGIISIPRADNPRFWGDIGSTGAYIVYLNPVAWEYSFTYPFSTGNRNVRQEGTEMVLDAEQQGDIWDYLVVEEQPKPRKKVRTMTGKPHTPRKLVKDQAITPEEAAKRVKLEAEGHDNVLIIGTVDGNPSAMYYSTAPGRNVDEFGFQTGRILVGTEDELTDELSRISGMLGHDTRMEQAGKNWMQNVATSSRFDAEMTGQDMYYTREEAMARARELGCQDIHTHEMDGRTVYMPCYTHERYESMRYNEMTSSRYIYGAERMAEDKREETVVDSKEESGITTETRQYKRKKYNPEKMKQDIPSKILNQTDSDDIWVALAAGILGIGIGASIERMGIIERFTRRSD